jgi:hypothetical protein
VSGPGEGSEERLEASSVEDVTVSFRKNRWLTDTYDLTLSIRCAGDPRNVAAAMRTASGEQIRYHGLESALDQLVRAAVREIKRAYGIEEAKR